MRQPVPDPGVASIREVRGTSAARLRHRRINAFFEEPADEPHGLLVAQVGYHDAASQELAAIAAKQAHAQRRFQPQLPPGKIGNELVARGVAEAAGLDGGAVDSPASEVGHGGGIGEQPLVVQHGCRLQGDCFPWVALLQVPGWASPAGRCERVWRAEATGVEALGGLAKVDLFD